MITPILETDRILLRPLTTKDAEIAFQNWTSDPDVAKYMSWTLHRSVHDTVEWLAMEENNALKETNYTWGFVLKEKQELFGSGGFFYNEEQKMFEFGYCIMKQYWNFGLTTEVSKAMTNFAVQTLGIACLFAKHAKDNPASGRVLEKAGFVYRRDGEYVSIDGKRAFASREYLFCANRDA